MAIVKMKKLRLLALRSERDELLKELMLLGCVEISEPAAALADEEIASVFRKSAGPTAEVKSEVSGIGQAIRLLDKYAPAKKPLLAPRPEVGKSDFLNDDSLSEALRVSGVIIDLDDRIRRLAADESRERSLIASLAPWDALDVPLGCTGTVTTAVLLGTVPAAVELGALKERVCAVCPESEVFVVSSDKTQHYLEIICLKSAVAEVTGALRELAFSVVSFSALSGTAKESIAAGETRLAEMAKAKEALAAEISSFAPQREELKLCADRMSTKLGQAEMVDRLLEDDAVILFNGWVPVPDVDRLETFLGGRTCAWELADPDMEKLSEIPIKIKSNKLTAPYNLVTGMYSLPAYNGLDANPFVMPAFALFFGIMFADMAYGLIMLAAGLAILLKSRPRGGVKNLAGMMVQCGITTFIMGFLTAGFFGDAIPVVGKIFGQTWTLVPTFATIHIGSAAAINLPLNLLEGNNPLYVLVAAMCIGVIHLALGVGIGVYLKIRDGQWLDALLNDVSWWIMFVGLALNILGHGKTVLYIGIAMMVVGAVLGGKGFGRITAVFSAVYNGVTGYLGDILSYSRLMALMLAGSVIASVFNQLGSLGGIFLFIPVFLIGHTLNFGLNIIGCFVHTMRLQFLEFFSKWYRDGGRPFQPLTIQTNYVDIKED